MAEKPLVWIGSSLARVRQFPREARRECGHELGRVQQGRMPSDWKRLPGIGLGVLEIRIHTHVEHRVLYVASFPEAVYVLHAFEKRSRQMSRSDVELSRRRFADLLRLRSQRRAD